MFVFPQVYKKTVCTDTKTMRDHNTKEHKNMNMLSLNSEQSTVPKDSNEQ